MEILGIWFPIMQSLWSLMFGVCIGYIFGRPSAYKSGWENCIKEMQKQQSAQMMAEYMNRMMGGGQ
jgi:hypothetical protein